MLIECNKKITSLHTCKVINNCPILSIHNLPLLTFDDDDDTG